MTKAETLINGDPASPSQLRHSSPRLRNHNITSLRSMLFTASLSGSQ